MSAQTISLRLPEEEVANITKAEFRPLTTRVRPQHEK